MTGGQKTLQELFDLKIRGQIEARTVGYGVEIGIQGKTVRVSGFSHFRQTDACIRSTAAEVFHGYEVACDLKILNRGRARFHQVVSTVASFWKNPDDSNPDQRQTQVLAGAVIRTFFSSGKFVYAQASDGYVGYVPKTDLVPVDEKKYLRWKNGACGIILETVEADDVVLAPGTRLPLEKGKLILPGGKKLSVGKDSIRATRPADPAYFRTVADLAARFRGTPYLWGGKTAAGIDCSGFVQTIALEMGISLPRDASMQASVGEYVGYLPDYADLLPGDLMFFMNDKAFIFHVGIYAGKGRYLHSSGKLGVDYSELKAGGKNYSDRYGTTFVFARRVHT